MGQSVRLGIYRRQLDCHCIELSVLQVVRESIYDAFYRLTNAQTQITAYVFDVVR